MALPIGSRIGLSPGSTFLIPEPGKPHPVRIFIFLLAPDEHDTSTLTFGTELKPLPNQNILLRSQSRFHQRGNFGSDHSDRFIIDGSEFALGRWVNMEFGIVRLSDVADHKPQPSAK